MVEITISSGDDDNKVTENDKIALSNMKVSYNGVDIPKYNIPINSASWYLPTEINKTKLEEVVERIYGLRSTTLERLNENFILNYVEEGNRPKTYPKIMYTNDSNTILEIGLIKPEEPSIFSNNKSTSFQNKYSFDEKNIYERGIDYNIQQKYKHIIYPSTTTLSINDTNNTIGDTFYDSNLYPFEYRTTFSATPTYWSFSDFYSSEIFVKYLVEQSYQLRNELFRRLNRSFNMEKTTEGSIIPTKFVVEYLSRCLIDADLDKIILTTIVMEIINTRFYVNDNNKDKIPKLFKFMKQKVTDSEILKLLKNILVFFFISQMTYIYYNDNKYRELDRLYMNALNENIFYVPDLQVIRTSNPSFKTENEDLKNFLNETSEEAVMFLSENFNIEKDFIKKIDLKNYKELVTPGTEGTTTNNGSKPETTTTNTGPGAETKSNDDSNMNNTNTTSQIWIIIGLIVFLLFISILLIAFLNRKVKKTKKKTKK